MAITTVAAYSANVMLLKILILNYNYKKLSYYIENFRQILQLIFNMTVQTVATSVLQLAKELNKLPEVFCLTVM